MQNDSWTPGSKHYYELPSIAINRLNQVLESLVRVISPDLDNPIILKDTNAIYTQSNPLWQVESGEDWIIKPKEWL